MKSKSQRHGDAAEQQALDYLLARGLRLMERNVASRVGEIDLLMDDGGEWVFVEVRARVSSAFGGAAASVTPAKQRRLQRQANTILKARFGDRQWPPCRFDVVAIQGSQIDWIRSAF